MKQVKIGDRLVGEGQPCFLIAEAGVNHNGSLGQAKQLINAAKDAGADAIKFQSFRTEYIATKYAEKANYQKEKDSSNSQYSMLKKLELKNSDLQALFEHATEKHIIFLCSGFDVESVDFLDRLGVFAFKVPSGEITNFPLLKYIAQKEKPVILSTGMSTLSEIRDAINVLDNNGVKDLLLLYCVTSYPAKANQVNLGVLQKLKRRFGLPVGFSDHTLGITFPIAARALGTAIIEKHFTLNKNSEGPDHKASLEPAEFAEMVKAIREVEQALGDSMQRSPEEEEIKTLVRRSIVANTRIPKGMVISAEMLDFKRPGTGISPKLTHKVIGRKAKVDIEYDELITFKKVV